MLKPLGDSRPRHLLDGHAPLPQRRRRLLRPVLLPTNFEARPMRPPPFSTLKTRHLVGRCRYAAHMRIDTLHLPVSLIPRLQPVLVEAELAGCSQVHVSLDSKGFAARIVWPDRRWEMAASEFNYLVGHMSQALREPPQ